MPRRPAQRGTGSATGFCDRTGRLPGQHPRRADERNGTAATLRPVGAEQKTPAAGSPGRARPVVNARCSARPRSGTRQPCDRAVSREERPAGNLSGQACEDRPAVRDPPPGPGLQPLHGKSTGPCTGEAARRVSGSRRAFSAGRRSATLHARSCGPDRAATLPGRAPGVSLRRARTARTGVRRRTRRPGPRRSRCRGVLAPQRGV